jgi:hypothetical protein
MPTIFAANESRVLINGQPVEGVRAIEYQRQQSRASIYAIGTGERIGVTSGAMLVQGRLRVVSTSAALDGLAPDASFQISALLAHGDSKLNVSFDECYLDGKSMEMSVGGQAEAVYSFTATRVTEGNG